MRTHLLALGLFAFATPARVIAEPRPASDAPRVDAAPAAPLPDYSALSDRALHLDVEFGADLGQVNAGQMTGTTGLHAGVGLRRGRFAVMVVEDLVLTESADKSADGGYQRFGIEPRVSLWQGRIGSLVRPTTSYDRGDLWIAPGVGIETSTQGMMPALSRNDASLAIGFSRSHHDGTRSWGAFLALRAIAAKPAPGERGYDVSALVTGGLTLGR